MPYKRIDNRFTDLPVLERVTARVRAIAAALDHRQQEALKIALREPNLEKIIKENWAQISRGVTKTAAIKESLLAALVILAQTFGATAPDQLIGEIDKQRGAMVHPESKMISEALREKVPVMTGEEEGLLKQNAADVSAIRDDLMKRFRKDFEQIVEFVDTDPSLGKMTADQKSTNIAKAFMEKNRVLVDKTLDSRNADVLYRAVKTHIQMIL